MGPLKQLVYGLRRYDVDRCIALAQESHSHPQLIKKELPDPNTVQVYMSLKAKVYLVLHC